MPGNIVKVGPYECRISKVDAFTQFHVARRILPLFASISAGDLKSLAGAGKPDGDNVIMALGNAVASMKDEDSDYILKTCLSAVEISQGKNPNGSTLFSQVMVNGVLMFDKLDLMSMIMMAWEVIKYNGGNFTAVLGKLATSSQSEEGKGQA